MEMEKILDKFVKKDRKKVLAKLDNIKNSGRGNCIWFWILTGL